MPPLSADKREGDTDDAISAGLDAAHDVLGAVGRGDVDGAAHAAAPNLEQLGELGAGQLGTW